jgi:hypothetical protein
VQKWLSAARPSPLAQPQKAAAITLNLKEDLKEEVFKVHGSMIIHGVPDLNGLIINYRQVDIRSGETTHSTAQVDIRQQAAWLFAI